MFRTSRNSRVIDVIEKLRAHGIEVQVHDPFVDVDEAHEEYGVEPVARADLKPLTPLSLPLHIEIRDAGWDGVRSLLKPQVGSYMT